MGIGLVQQSEACGRVSGRILVAKNPLALQMLWPNTSQIPCPPGSLVREYGNCCPTHLKI